MGLQWRGVKVRLGPEPGNKKITADIGISRCLLRGSTLEGRGVKQVNMGKQKHLVAGSVRRI